ncbi:hypothetical protein H4218_000319 [Coemansia sp. IMI 209128]|nr:hypothetical protein H4218_000319 [Coemansia sp. IMI 209128]
MLLLPRYKLRVNFVGVDTYEDNGSIVPFRKLIYLASADELVGHVREGIKALFHRMYPAEA